MTADLPVVSTSGFVDVAPGNTAPVIGAAANASVKGTITAELTTLDIEGTKFEVTPGSSDVTVYPKDGQGVQTKDAGKHAVTDNKDPSVSIREDFKAAAAYGAWLEVTETGPVVKTTGKVFVMPAAANDTAIVAASEPAPVAAAAATAVATAPAPLKIGEKDENGWTYHRLTSKASSCFVARRKNAGDADL